MGNFKMTDDDVLKLLHAINEPDDTWVSWKTLSKPNVTIKKVVKKEVDLYDSSATISDDIISKLQQAGKDARK